MLNTEVKLVKFFVLHWLTGIGGTLLWDAVFLTLGSLSCFVGKHKEKVSSVADEARGKRNAIRLQEAYTVETVVVADSDMVQYHGAEAAQRFLLTVMNMVRIFCIAN